MTSLYVAWQNELSREWVPVAKLSRVDNGYQLRYTKGAGRAIGFSGLGRMAALDKVYFSPELFPFFANRIISKSRPEFQSYKRWLGLEEQPTDDPLAILGVTGGLRATDSLELIPEPNVKGSTLTLDFFSRGLRHLLPADFSGLIAEGAQAYLMLDVQNQFDGSAVVLRSDDPKSLLGYLPRYFSKAVANEIQRNPDGVKVVLRRINKDAPLDMRLLFQLTVSDTKNRSLFDDDADFQPWDSSVESLGKIENWDAHLVNSN